MFVNVSYNDCTTGLLESSPVLLVALGLMQEDKQCVLCKSEQD